MHVAIQVSSNMCVGAAESAMPCLGRAFLTPCTVSRHAHPRDCSRSHKSSPVTGSFDPMVFFASD